MKSHKRTAAIPDYDIGRVFERPDGFYWRSKTDAGEYGPFPGLTEALADMGTAETTVDDDDLLEVAETLEEAEAEVGIAGWVDPESGELSEEERPRIEDH